MAEAERIKALGEAVAREARDPVNQPMINNWLEAMGNDNPRFRAGGRRRRWPRCGRCPACAAVRPAADPLHGMMQMLTTSRVHLRARHQLRPEPTTATCTSASRSA